MPRDKSHEMKVGIFVTAGLAIFALFVVVLMGIGFSGEEVLYKVRFGDVAGLENGSIVRLGGLKVGRVESVGIAPDDPGRMEAVILVNVGSPIRKNSKVQVTSVGVTSSMFLAISLGTADSPLLKAGEILQGEEAASFQDVINEVDSVATNLNKILVDLGDAAELISGEAKDIVRDIRVRMRGILGTTDRVAKRMENILSQKNEQNINRFLTSLARVADTLDKNIEPSARELQATLRKAGEALGTIDRTARSYTSLAGDASKVLADVRASVAQARGVIASAGRVGASLEKVVGRGGEALDSVKGVLEGEIRGIRQDLRGELTRTGVVLRDEIAQGGKALGGVKKVVEGEIRGVREDLKGELGQTGDALRKEIGRVGAQAKKSLAATEENLAATLASIEGAAKQVDEFLASNRKELREVILNFRSLSKRVDNIFVELSGGPDGDKLSGAAENLRLSLARAQSILSQVDYMVARNREDIQLLISDLRDTADNLNQFTTTLRDNPSTVIFRSPTPPREFQ